MPVGEDVEMVVVAPREQGMPEPVMGQHGGAMIDSSVEEAEMVEPSSTGREPIPTAVGVSGGSSIAGRGEATRRDTPRVGIRALRSIAINILEAMTAVPPSEYHFFKDTFLASIRALEKVGEDTTALAEAAGELFQAADSLALLESTDETAFIEAEYKEELDRLTRDEEEAVALLQLKQNAVNDSLTLRSRLQGALKEVTAEINKKATKAEGVQAEIQALEAKLKALQEEFEGLRGEYDIMAARKRAIREEIAKAEAETMVKEKEKDEASEKWLEAKGRKEEREEAKAVALASAEARAEAKGRQQSRLVNEVTDALSRLQAHLR